MKETKNHCHEEAGLLIPVIDLNGCEAKGPCVQVCPYNVLALQPITEQDRASLSFIGKIKTRVHGNDKAYVINPDLCHACGLCVSACPEKAIKLRKVNF
jgi:NAD-dependent dihydropyrimidine dehydrogenase PreA subunit